MSFHPSSSQTALVSQGVMAREVGDETVILNLETGTYFGLNQVGATIWKYISEGKDLASICEALEAEFEVTQQAAQEDVRVLLNELEQNGLIKLQESDKPAAAG
jgi:hypothetical protein